MLSPTKEIGTLGELAVAQDLIRKKWDVYTAIGDCTKVDVIAISHSGKLMRIQVKTVADTSMGVVDVAGYKVISGKSVWYDRNDFDYVALYAVDRNVIAYIPFEILHQRTMRLRFEQTKNGQVKDVRWFSDFSKLENE